MSDRIETVIAEILRCAGILLPNDYTRSCDYNRALNELAAQIDAVVHPRIDTVEQLDALPTLSIVRDEWMSAAGWHHSGIWERRGMSWHCIAAPVMPPGHPRPNLPARLLYRPEDKQ